MRKYTYFAAVGLLLVAVGFALMVQAPALAQDAPAEPTEGMPFLSQYYEAWSASPHNAADTEAFRHWDGDGAIPADCAKCHSTTGYLDFLGEDGSEFGVVDAEETALGTTVNCDACHNNTASSLTSVTFPSGMAIETQDNAARCMECHQGRASTVQVNAALEGAGLTEDLNTPSADLRFVNIHYYAAAAALYGSEVMGGYQYPDRVYQMQNVHVPGYDTCTSCHNPHSLEIDVATCATCHEDVETVEDLRDIRMVGSMVDFDGDGSRTEPLAEELTGLQDMLYTAIQTYAAEVAGTPIVYDTVNYPYFFIDTNADGVTDADEVAYPNAYNAWTGALLPAAYNYQMAVKDDGAYAHNPAYYVQLMYDSIESLNQQIAQPVDLTSASRTESGHFDVTAYAFRDWDADGEVPARCARCHTAEGLPFFLENGVNIASEPSNSLSCSTCHNDLSEFTLHPVPEIPFPSGAVLTFGEEDPANMCLACHQGRESTVSVNRAISTAGVGDDEVSADLTFRNPHYYAAGAALFGSEAQGGYQFEGQEYSGRYLHDGERFTTCTSCHREHELTVRANQCEDCHEGVESDEDIALIRYLGDEGDNFEPIDYNGNGDATEPIAAEIQSFVDALIPSIQAYALETTGVAVAYDPNAHPYWYNDTNGNGVADPDEVNRDNRYVSWTPNMLRAAYNYQFIVKGPGAFAHNADYAMQILYDSLSVMGAPEVENFTRPPVTASETALAN